MAAVLPAYQPSYSIWKPSCRSYLCSVCVRPIRDPFFSDISCFNILCAMRLYDSYASFGTFRWPFHEPVDNLSNHFTIAGPCQTCPWSAVPDWTLMPEYRCRNETADYRKKCRCRTNFSPALRHFHMIFQYNIAKITPSAAVYGRAGCIPISTNSNMDVQGVSISTASILDVQDVPLFWMLECRTDRHRVGLVPELTKVRTPEPVWYRK